MNETENFTSLWSARGTLYRLSATLYSVRVCPIRTVSTPFYPERSSYGRVDQVRTLGILLDVC